ncbi:MAG: hypothetical protein RL701_3310 [Pseudomonadota bacterium]|jgi:hypothetical protein
MFVAVRVRVFVFVAVRVRVFVFVFVRPSAHTDPTSSPTVPDIELVLHYEKLAVHHIILQTLPRGHSVNPGRRRVAHAHAHDYEHGYEHEYE